MFEPGPVPEHDDALDYGVDCPMCEAPGSWLGRLASLDWWRCRGCGIDFSTVASA